MKIGVFSHYFTPEIGAPSARFQEMAREWVARGHGVEVVTCCPNHPTGVVYPGYRPKRYQREIIDGITIHRNWSYITPNKGLVKKVIGHLSFYLGARWFSLPRMNRVDVAIGTSPTFFAAMAALRAARQFHVPFLMDVRDLWPAALIELGVLRNRMLIRMLERWEMLLYRHAARVIPVTESFRSNLLQRGLPTAKVVTIPNGADVSYWSPVTNARSLRLEQGIDDRFVVLYVGALGVSQALHTVLECADRLRDARRFLFVLVGEGAEKESLMSMVREWRMTNVEFHDPVDKAGVKRWYAMANLCLVPLRNIPIFSTFIPSKMFEILAMGRPLLASVRGEAADILRRSQGAEVVEPEDSRAMAERLVALSASPERLEAMGRCGRAFVTAHYSRSVLAERYLSVMEQVLNGSGAE